MNSISLHFSEVVVSALGIIEGYYGRPWSWAARTSAMQFLARHDYRFFIYAPKADTHLRKRWREPYPQDQLGDLARFAVDCEAAGVTFGVGLSPYELYLGFNDHTRKDLAARLSMLKAAGARWLAILFDDMRGDVPSLARSQTDILHWIADRGEFERLILCPTYYTDDPVLDRVFGRRPADYLETLGRTLDPSIDLFWTGEEVCAREIGVGHLKQVGKVLGRKPVLWDNYPVNDGPHMSAHLHLRGFTGRPAAIGAQLAHPDALVIDVAGDASIQMNIQEMSTATQYGLPVKVFILNNEWMGMVRQWQELLHGERYAHSYSHSLPDFVKLAEAYGWLGLRADKPSELDGGPQPRITVGQRLAKLPTGKRKRP